MPAPLLDWVQRLAAIAQSGLTFSPGVYDRLRYEEIRRLAAEMASYDHGDVEAVDALFASDTGYATPKLICRGAVFDESGRILLVRETADGLWTPPGGWIDVGESPASAVAREVREESGYEVRVTKLAALFDKHRHDHPPAPHHAYLVYFLCEPLGQEPAASVEVSEAGWFAEDRLPPLSPGRCSLGQVRRMFEHHRRPDLPTDFD